MGLSIKFNYRSYTKYVLPFIPQLELNFEYYTGVSKYKHTEQKSLDLRSSELSIMKKIFNSNFSSMHNPKKKKLQVKNENEIHLGVKEFLGSKQSVFFYFTILIVDCQKPKNQQGRLLKLQQQSAAEVVEDEKGVEVIDLG